MSERSAEATERSAQHDHPAEPPPPEVIDFIRFCHRRRRANWPELYDEMCAVAARHEFRGWGHEQLAARGVTFSLLDMPRLAGWVRIVLAGLAEARVAQSAPVAPVLPTASQLPAIA